jgi:hypothetical protein
MALPQHMVWQYYQSLRRRVIGVANATDEEIIRQDTATSIMLAVTVVEAFFNLYFRVLVSQPNYAQHEARLLKDFEKRKGLEYKLKNWFPEIIGKPLDFTAPIPKAFSELKVLRNTLMHFTSSHQTANLPGFQIQALADVTAYQALTAKDAMVALTTAEQMVSEVFRLIGYSEQEILYLLQQWTGKVPL